MVAIRVVHEECRYISRDHHRREMAQVVDGSQCVHRKNTGQACTLAGDEYGTGMYSLAEATSRPADCRADGATMTTEQR